MHYLRSLADSRAIIAELGHAKRVVVVGSGFIGLEAVAALRTRGLEVHVVSPDARPLEKVLGPELGDFIRALHEEHGVVFHLGQKLGAIEPGQVLLADGSNIAADLVIAGASSVSSPSSVSTRADFFDAGRTSASSSVITRPFGWRLLGPIEAIASSDPVGGVTPIAVPPLEMEVTVILSVLPVPHNEQANQFVANDR